MPWVYLYKLIVKMFTDLIYIHPLCRTGEDATLYESNWRGTLFNNTVSLLLYVVGLFVTIWLRLRKLHFKIFVLFSIFSLWLWAWNQGVTNVFVFASKEILSVLFWICWSHSLAIYGRWAWICSVLCLFGWMINELVVSSLLDSKWSPRLCVFCWLMICMTTFTL